MLRTVLFFLIPAVVAISDEIKNYFNLNKCELDLTYYPPSGNPLQQIVNSKDFNYINCTIDDSGYRRISADFTDRRVRVLRTLPISFEQPQEYDEALYDSVIIDSDTMLEKSGLNCDDFPNSLSLCDMTAGSKQEYYEDVIRIFRVVRDSLEKIMEEMFLAINDLRVELRFFLKDPELYSFVIKRYEGMLEELLMMIRDPANPLQHLVTNLYIGNRVDIFPAFIKSDLSHYTGSAADRFAKKFHGVHSKLDEFYTEGSTVSALRDSIKERYSGTCTL